MEIPKKAAEDIRAIADVLISALDDQIAHRGVSEANVVIDAAIICLCYVMKRSEPPLKDKELLRRVKDYYRSLDLVGAPGGSS